MLDSLLVWTVENFSTTNDMLERLKWRQINRFVCLQSIDIYRERNVRIESALAANETEENVTSPLVD